MNSRPTTVLILIALACGGVAGTAYASPELAKAKNCLACHTEEKKLVGPSYKDIAAKYAGNPNAEAQLIKKVREGGAGIWGPVPMPANPQVSAEEAKALVKWVLSQK